MTLHSDHPPHVSRDVSSHHLCVTCHASHTREGSCDRCHAGPDVRMAGAGASCPPSPVSGVNVTLSTELPVMPRLSWSQGPEQRLQSLVWSRPESVTASVTAAGVTRPPPASGG